MKTEKVRFCLMLWAGEILEIGWGGGGVSCEIEPHCPFLPSKTRGDANF